MIARHGEMIADDRMSGGPSRQNRPRTGITCEVSGVITGTGRPPAPRCCGGGAVGGCGRAGTGLRTSDGTYGTPLLLEWGLGIT